MNDKLTYETVESYKHLHVGDVVHIIRNESREYRCPICHGKGKFKCVATTSDGINVSGKMKCKYCIGIGAIAVNRYIPLTVTIKVIEIWSDGDIIVRTDNLYQVNVNEILYSSYEHAQIVCNSKNTNTYVKCGNFHADKNSECIPNDSYVDFGKDKFYIDINGFISRLEC